MLFVHVQCILYIYEYFPCVYMQFTPKFPRIMSPVPSCTRWTISTFKFRNCSRKSPRKVNFSSSTIYKPLNLSNTSRNCFLAHKGKISISRYLRYKKPFWGSTDLTANYELWWAIRFRRNLRKFANWPAIPNSPKLAHLFDYHKPYIL